MDPTLTAGSSALRQLLSRSFGSTAEAATQVCALLRSDLGVDLAYASHFEDGRVTYLAVDEVLASGLRTGFARPANPEFAELLRAGTALVSGSDLGGSPFEALGWPVEVGLTSYAATLLWDSDGRYTGILAVLDRAPRTFSDADLELLELLGGILSREKELDLARERERSRAAQLEASERRYRELVDDLGDIVVETDATGRITYVNRAFTDLVGMSVEDTGGWDMMAYVHPDDRGIAEEQLAAALNGEDTAAAEAAREVRFLPPDQPQRYMSVRGRPLFDESGDFLGLRGILHDVTVRVESEQRVRAALVQAEVALAEAEAARDEAQRASVAKSEFLSRMSHELRTPMNAILGFGQLLEMGELSGEDAENVDQILRAGRHLLDLINEVLDVVRIESGALGLSLEPVEVGAVLSESLDLVRTAASRRGITVRTPNRLDGAMVVADRQRLKQVLVNLLSNAVKYNHDDGEIVVSWAPRPPADGEESPGFLRVEVRDTGQGIPADRLDDVFTPFERLGAEGTGIEGTGVGLSLTRTLVEALGGRIGVASEPGRGSTFWVDLPAAGSPAPEAPSAADAPDLAATVLYVEDNPSNITLVRRVLARRPHVRLVVVQDGGEAIEVAQQLVPDLVLLDLHLPGMHGAGILSLLRASDDDRLRKVPIVVVTADLTVGNERRMLEAGATSFLPKPLDVHRLLAVVDEQLPLP